MHAPAIVTPTASRASWDLSDLVRDGQLDVDAVSAVLGLGLTIEADMSCSPNIGRSPSESDISDQSSMGWGHACETSGMSLPMRIPGEQLYAIPEETEDVTSLHSRIRSGDSTFDIDLRLLGLDSIRGRASSVGSMLTPEMSIVQQSMPDDVERSIIWEDEQSWRDTPSFR